MLFKKSFVSTLENSLLWVLIFFSFSFLYFSILFALIWIKIYIFDLQLGLFIIHFFDFIFFCFFIQNQLVLPIPHDIEFFLLKYFHPADLENPATEHINQRLNFIIKIKQLIIPDLSFHTGDIVFPVNPVSYNRLLWQGISLWRILISWRFVRQGLNKFISKYLNVSPSVLSVLYLDRLLFWLEVVPKGSIIALCCRLYVLDRDQCCVGVASEDSLVPHQVVIN